MVKISPGRPRIALLYVALGLITLALYSPSLTHEFLGYDDQAYVTENPSVRAGLSWSGLVWAGKSFSVSNWHPLTWVSHMLDCQFYGLKAWGHHLTNLLLHVANTLLVLLVFSRLTGALWRSACLAALFAWHPLHVESVAWIAERKDVLSTFFFLLTLWAYAGYGLGREAEAQSPKSKLQSPKARLNFYLLSLVFFACGLMSKPMVVTLPFVLLLLDYWPLGRMFGRMQPGEVAGGAASATSLIRLLVEKLPFFVLSAGTCVATVLAQQQGFAVVSRAGLPLGRRLAHALVSYQHYLGATFLPHGLAAHYPYAAKDPTWAVASAGLLIALLTLLAVGLAQRKRYLLVGWLWFLGTLVPVIGLVQVGDQAWADRYTYVPLIGIFVALIWGVGDLAGLVVAPCAGTARGTTAAVSGGKIYRLGLLILLAVIPVVLLACTGLQLRNWRNTRVLFEHAATVVPGNSKALTVLGSLAAEEGKTGEARRLYNRALHYSPHHPETHFHLGKLLDEEGKLDQAIGEYSQILWADQWREKAHLGIAIALAKQQRYDEAVQHYEAVLALNPASAVAENNLARVRHTQGKLEEAMKHYAAALKLNPALAQAQNNLGVLLLQRGQVEQGAAHLRAALKLNPGDTQCEYNLALALNQLKHWEQAAGLFSRLAPGRMQDANLFCEYGLALANLGRTREAMSRYARSLLLEPDNPEALNGLGWIAATAPQPEYRNGPEAVKMAERACELTERKRPAMLATLAAAHAEVGHFAEAITAAQAAMDAATKADSREAPERYAQLLEAFRAGKPWRSGR